MRNFGIKIEIKRDFAMSFLGKNFIIQQKKIEFRIVKNRKIKIRKNIENSEKIC